MSDSRKYSYINIPTPQMAFWNSEGKGGGGVLWTGIPKGLGVLLIGIPSTWGFPEGTDKSVKAQTNRTTHADCHRIKSNIQDKHLSIMHVSMFIYRTKSGLPLQWISICHVFLLCVSNAYSDIKKPIELILHNIEAKLDRICHMFHLPLVIKTQNNWKFYSFI